MKVDIKVKMTIDIDRYTHLWELNEELKNNLKNIEENYNYRDVEEKYYGDIKFSTNKINIIKIYEDE